MFDRFLSFLGTLSYTEGQNSEKFSPDDPRLCAAALMYHIIQADGVLLDVESERMEQRLRFVEILWELVYSDGVRHELEDNVVWRVSELLGIDSNERVALRQLVQKRNAHKKPILVVLHQENSTAGRVGQRLVKRGYELDIRRPPLGDALPETLDEHDGAVVFGGPMSANDPYDYVKRETEWLAVPLIENKPLICICLGAQMLVNHLGGKVYSHPKGDVEIGWYDLKPTAAGADLMSWPKKIYQFHVEGFTLPRGAELLAGSLAYPNQAFRYGGNAWAVQFHAELTLAMMHRWSIKGAHRFSLPNAQQAEAHLAGRFIYDPPVSKWLDDFLDIVFGCP
ncbi:putative glutamine amidotransferase-like protein YfeJ [Nymphon striatum]|nr:putative glutamine amidotransferase-like protein YfeJ [Nymphon striatum]